LNAEDPTPQNRYDLTYSYHNSEYDDVIVKVPAMMLSNTALNVLEDSEETLSVHQIVNRFNLGKGFSADDSIIELEDGRIWLIPAYQNTFNVGDIISVFIENSSLAYLIKLVKIGGIEKEVLIPSKKLHTGFYQVF